MGGWKSHNWPGQLDNTNLEYHQEIHMWYPQVGGENSSTTLTAALHPTAAADYLLVFLVEVYMCFSSAFYSYNYMYVAVVGAPQ